jgi:hypothetical protein
MKRIQSIHRHVSPETNEHVLRIVWRDDDGSMKTQVFRGTLEETRALRDSFIAQVNANRE